ncbi:MAG: hypothetical protein ACXVPU_09720 [Bacteroidia bacterium]
MKKITAFVFAILFACFFISWHKKPQNVVPTRKKIQTWLINELEKTKQQLTTGFHYTFSVKRLYSKARRHYKHVELFVEYCSPKEAEYFINGPIKTKYDDLGIQHLVMPHGFQRIEEILYDSEKSDQTATILREEQDMLIERLSKLQKYYSTVQLDDNQFLEMCQLELLRIVTRTLNGYDATISKSNIEESFWSLEGIEQIMKAFNLYPSGNNEKIKTIYPALLKNITSAKLYLKIHKDYNSFNRLEFIIKHVNILNESLIEYHYACNLPWSKQNQAINLQQHSLFGKESLNLQYSSSNIDSLKLNSENVLEKTSVSFNSRFDNYLSGDTTQLNKREINGYNLFNGKALCGSCHIAPLFYGTISELNNDFVLESNDKSGNTDNKYFDQAGDSYLLKRLYTHKTSSVRNIELTKLNLHNSPDTDLKQLIESYHKSECVGFGFKLPDQILPFDSLQLSANEKEDIILFLKTLTDTATFSNISVHLPAKEIK